MVEFGVVCLIAAYAFFHKNKERVLYLFVFLLSFHTFLKRCFVFYFGGGNIFSYWKELVVLILLYRVFFAGKKFLKISKNVMVALLGYCFIIVLFLFVTGVESSALPTFRDHIFPLLLLVIISSLRLFEVNRFVNIFILALFISSIMGFVQLYVFNNAIATLMGAIDFVDGEGYVKYTSSSFRIMGVQRMFGIQAGPNLFGVYMAIGVVFIVGVLTGVKKDGSKLYPFFYKVTLLLSVGCLLLSFSRAGWVIAILGVSIISYCKLSLNKIFKYLILISMLFFIGVSYLFIYLPDEVEVISSSLQGKEASAADRSDNVLSGFDRVISEPLGHGLGTSDNRYETVAFFAESALARIGFEIGLLGMIIFLFMHGTILNTINTSKNSFYHLGIALGVPSVLVCVVSINPFGMPYIYYWWCLLGLGLNKSLKRG